MKEERIEIPTKLVNEVETIIEQKKKEIFKDLAYETAQELIIDAIKEKIADMKPKQIKQTKHERGINEVMETLGEAYELLKKAKDEIAAIELKCMALQEIDEVIESIDEITTTN